MRKQSTESPAPSRTARENPEAHLHGRAQGWLQDLFEAELDKFLGQGKAPAQGGCGCSCGLSQRPRQAPGLNAPELLKEGPSRGTVADGMRADTLTREAAA